MQTVTQAYLDGIREGRAVFKAEGLANAAAHLDNIQRTIKGFGAQSEVGQMLRGERDFWHNQLKKG